MTSAIGCAPRRLAVSAAVLVAFLGLVSVLVGPVFSIGPGSVAALPPAPTSVQHVAGGAGSLTCGSGYPSYAALPGGIWPLDPNFYSQGPCGLVAVDEIHATFSSNVSGSGDRWTLPWHLPALQPLTGGVLAGMYVGMVVTGDAASVGNQSYLEVDALPASGNSGTVNWTISIAVLSLVNASAYAAAGCPSTSLNLSWDNAYFCEIDDLAGGNPIEVFPPAALPSPLPPLLPGLPGGSWLNLTFVQPAVPVVAGGQNLTGLTIYANASLVGSSLETPDEVIQLNSARTGTSTFNAAYSAACPDVCTLRWGLPYGLGVGIDPCPVASVSYAGSCLSYDSGGWARQPPPFWGPPLFWNGSAYSGNYRYFSPLSASGVCDPSPPGQAIVATCTDFTSSGGNGFYPYFSLNSSGLDFGTSYPWTRAAFGETTQYTGDAFARDLTPLIVSGVADSSRFGFVPSGEPVNVSANVSDLGSVRAVELNYTLNGIFGPPVPMHLANGTATSGTYEGAVPAGPNGTLIYRVEATNAAGATVASGPRTVNRGPLPRYPVTVVTVPSSCGTVALAGGVYANGTTLALPPGSYPVVASSCYAHTFSAWTASPEVTVAAPASPSTSIEVRGEGVLTAVFRYVPPPVNVTVEITPARCGPVRIGGVAWGNGSTATLTLGVPSALAASGGCPGDSFAGWTVSGNLSIDGPTLTAFSNGSLAAAYVPNATSFTVRFVTEPTSCGGIGWGGANYTTNESIAVVAGTYPVRPDPCTGYGFVNFTTSSGIRPVGSAMQVSGPGTITENNYRLTLVRVATEPTGCGGVEVDGKRYPDGSLFPVTNHTAFTATPYSCSGHYVEAASASGGLTMIGTTVEVNGSGALLVVSLPGSPHVFVGFETDPADCGLIRFNGTTYANGGYGYFEPSAVEALGASGCRGYALAGWSSTGGITVVGNTAWLNGSGSIEATFGPIVPLLIHTEPAGCGGLEIGGSTYAGGGLATLVAGVSYRITPEPCAFHVFAGYATSPTVQLNGTGELTVAGPGMLTVTFAPAIYSVGVSLEGRGCGAVVVGGEKLSASSAIRLESGEYPLDAVPCATSAFEGWNASGNLSIRAAVLNVSGAGELTALFEPVAPSVVVVGPSVAYVGASVQFGAVIRVPVGSAGYAYAWSFGDGTVNVTTQNTTSHRYSAPGSYLVTVDVTDPYGRTATAQFTVEVVAPPSGGGGSAGLVAVALGGTGAGIGGGALVARRRRSRRQAG